MIDINSTESKWIAMGMYSFTELIHLTPGVLNRSEAVTKLIKMIEDKPCVQIEKNEENKAMLDEIYMFLNNYEGDLMGIDGAIYGDLCEKFEDVGYKFE